MKKIKVIIIRRETGDSYYGTSELSWARTFYPSDMKGWSEGPERMLWTKHHEYWGEVITFADAIEIDGKIYIDSAALGKEEFHTKAHND